MTASATMVKFVAVVLTALIGVVSWTEAARAEQTPYERLGLQHNATSDDILAAYKTHADTWHVEELYEPAEIQKIIEIEHAYYLLSNNLTRRDYDYFQFDELQGDFENIRKQYEGKTQAAFLQFPIWEPRELGKSIESTAETVTFANYGDLVLDSPITWVIQIYSVASPESHAFAPVWDKIVDLLDGVVKVGRLELGEIPLSLILAERNWLHGYPFFRNGLPAIIAIQPGCKTLDCINRYYEEKTSEAIIDWVATKLFRLPRILYYNAQTLMTDIVQKSPPHKIKVLQFSTTGERAAPYLRKAAKDYWEYAVFAMILWRETEATFWESRIGVEYAPATLFVKDPGLPPVIHHGKLNSSTFKALMEKHKTFELPQLRTVSSASLGCDVSNYSLAGNETKIWYCVIGAGRPGLPLNQLRGVLKGVQDQLAAGAAEETSPTPGVKAFKDRRLSLAWLDGEMQKDFCYFYLHSESMFEACGPRKYELDDIPKVFLIRYVRVDMEEETAPQKKRWLPKTTWEKQAEEELKYAAQLVTKYNGSTDVSEIVDWISSMVTEGDDESLPSFRGKSPDLVAEESIPFTEKTQEFVSSKKAKLVEKGQGFLRLAQDFREDSKFLPLVLFIVIFYSTACFFGARQRKIRQNQIQVSTESVASEVVEDVTQDISNSEQSAGQMSSSISEGLRRREPFQAS